MISKLNCAAVIARLQWLVSLGLKRAFQADIWIRRITGDKNGRDIHAQAHAIA